MTELRAYGASDTVTTLATCFKLVRRDGVILGFTDADTDLEIEHITYHACGGITRSALEASHDAMIDNLEIEGVLDHRLITCKDLLMGKYDQATITIFLVNRCNLSGPKTHLRTGWFGAISADGNKFTAQIYGMLEAFDQTVGEIYSPMCRARLGDARCCVNLLQYQHAGKVHKIQNGQLVDKSINKADGFYTGGALRFTSGQCCGQQYEVLKHAGNIITIGAGEAVEVRPNDSFTLFPGCDKTLGTCIDKFNNAVNFRGEPFIPNPQKW